MVMIHILNTFTTKYNNIFESIEQKLNDPNYSLDMLMKR